ncbi:NEDD4-binding protein 2 [Exaiptasia diaphana]|uniref:Uncharacterized protein n=1 Tax=Exaiptasia diaphana TaxID=2652724 RepID=A0A913Y5I9_EXADI|nr:NEDD4-binding protein 2 [Exaiptasia diaphana]KXJ22434.1 NEDD4-binding protein 2 [Exaiptasia diaphana]
MDSQRIRSGTPNRQKTDEKAAALDSLQEMFSGSLEPSVVNLILSESDYNVDDAIEKLFTLANTNPVTQSKLDAHRSSTTDNECIPRDGNTRSGRPTDTKMVLYDSIDDIGLDQGKEFHGSFNPKGHVQTGVSHVGKRLVDSGDTLVNSCISSSSETQNHGRKRKEDVNESELSEPFKQFMKNFMSANSNSNEWSSTKSVNQIEHSSHSNTGFNEMDSKMPQEESNGSNLKRTSQRNSAKSLNDISKTSNSAMSSGEKMKNECSTTLPSWPDTKQLEHHFQNEHHQPQLCTNVSHNFNGIPQAPVQCHPQNISFVPNSNFRPHYQQFQPRTGYFSAPFVNQAFHIPRLRYQVPRQPVRHSGPGNYVRHRPGYASPQFRNTAFMLPSGKVIVIMRGLPGSGKSSFARAIKGNGVIYSTDDYFMRNGQYQFDIAYLGEAHEWNQIRAREAMKSGISPVIIDNTNIQAWQMKPYVSMAQRLGYEIILKEPDTSWKWDAKELFKRNQHGVSLSQIKNLMERYEHDLTTEHILKSTSSDAKPKEEIQQNIQQKTDTKFGLCESSVHEEKPGKVSKQQVNSGQNEIRKHINEPKHKHKERTEEKQPMTKQGIQFSDRKHNTSRNNTEKKVNDLSALRSHGSRSPVEEFEQYMADERKISENSAKHERRNNGEEKTPSPKPQRAKRERKTVEKYPPLKESQPLSDDSIERVGMIIGSSAVKMISEEGSEQSDLGELYNQQDSMERANDHTEDHKSMLFREEREKGGCFPSDNKDVTKEILTQQKIDFKLKALQESDMDSETENKYSQLSTRSINDDAYASDDEESDDVIVESDGDDKDDIDNNDVIKQRNGTTIIKSSCDVDNKIINDVSRKDPSKTGEVASLTKTTKKTEREEMFSPSANSSEDSESDMTGFEFLNTCFPDIDDQTLVNVLSYHGGDVNKAIETILNNMESYMEEANPNLDPANGNSSSSENNFRDDIHLKPPQCASSSVTLPNKANQGSFQMSIEPAVAFHLFEIFGPIDGVNVKGEFSADDLSIDVDMEFSKLLYHQWKKSIQKKKGLSSGSSAQQFRSPKSQRKQKQRTRLNIHDPPPPPPKSKSKPTDLREIMHEQLALEQSRHELEKRESDNNLAVVLKRQKLYAMFPGVDPSALEEIFEANRYELEPTVNMVQVSCNIQAKPTMLIQDETKNDNEEDWSQFAFFPEKEEKSFQTLDHPDYMDFRGEANMHYKLRDECFKKAALAFAQKQGELAQFYASQGHLHTEKIKEANNRAAAKILEHKNADNNPFVLDLHGLHVPEALQALGERLNPPDMIHRPKFISVVTGRGLHSKQGKAKIKPAVIDYLQRNNYRYEEMHAGQLKVFLK